MKKLIILLLILTGASMAQEFDVTAGNYDGGRVYFCTFTDVDSVDLVSGMYSEVFDWSDIASGTSSTITTACTYTTTSANDTLMVRIYGRYSKNDSWNLLDTVQLTLLSTTDGGTTTYGTLSLSAYAPEVRIQIKQKAATNDQANNGTAVIRLYGTWVNIYKFRP